MHVIRHPRDYPSASQGVSLAIGMFDGVHLGHRQVLASLKEHALRTGSVPLVITFDQHPAAIVAPSRKPSLIVPLEEKIRLISDSEIPFMWLVDFDLPFSRITAESFVKDLIRYFKPLTGITVGESFRFGHRQAGDIEFLKGQGQKLGFDVQGIPSVLSQGDVVSSTRIREFIREGLFSEAQRFLGRPYTLSGRVIRGQRLARQLGFPTTNLEVSDLVLPPSGVYSARVSLEGQIYQAAVNIGTRPSVDGSNTKLSVEGHLLDYQGECYDQILHVEFLKKLRDEKRFESLDDLQKAIARDVETVRQEVDLSNP